MNAVKAPVIESDEAHILRVLCLGNDFLGDDAFAFRVAQVLRRRDGFDVVETSESGFYLLEHLIGASRVIVVDTIQTGTSRPGTVHVVGAGDVETTYGASPHYVGLFEVLDLARALRLHVPSDVTIIAVETLECTTLGAPMSAALQQAVPLVVDVVENMAARELALRQAH